VNHASAYQGAIETPANSVGYAIQQDDQTDERIVMGDDKVLSYNSDLLQLRKAYKNGSLDMKIKTEYPNARELKPHLSSGSNVKSLLTINSRGRLAAGEGDKVTIFDVKQLIGQPTVAPVTADKTNEFPLQHD
jgi:E3 ubiquitin-protein ligase UBR4